MRNLLNPSEEGMQILTIEELVKPGDATILNAAVGSKKGKLKFK
jgi:hypothetical protein